MKGQTGGSTGGVEQSPSRRKRQAAKRRAAEARWAALASPVEVRRVGEPREDPPGGPAPE